MPVIMGTVSFLLIIFFAYSIFRAATKPELGLSIFDDFFTITGGRDGGKGTGQTYRWQDVSRFVVDGFVPGNRGLWLRAPVAFACRSRLWGDASTVTKGLVGYALGRRRLADMLNEYRDKALARLPPGAPTIRTPDTSGHYFSVIVLGLGKPLLVVMGFVLTLALVFGS